MQIAMRWARKFSAAVTLAWWGAAATLSACQSGGLPQLEGGVELGLRRGAAWTTFTVKPPYIIGPRGNLTLKKNRVAGQLDGRQYVIDINKNEAFGHGPDGNIALTIEDGPDSLEVAGSWNGSRVFFRITAESFRGTIALRGGGSLAAVTTCQYVLDRVEPDGARSGSSICTGMPERTLLEVPPTVQSWLTRSELLVLLLALLSVPPGTFADQPLGSTGWP